MSFNFPNLSYCVGKHRLVTVHHGHEFVTAIWNKNKSIKIKRNMMIASGLTHLKQQNDLLCWKILVFVLWRNCKRVMKTGCTVIMWTVIRTGCAVIMWTVMKTGCTVIMWTVIRTGCTVIMWTVIRTGCTVIMWTVIKFCFFTAPCTLLFQKQC
jgi:hypothetical protein